MIIFKTAKEFRSWLQKNHEKAAEIYVGYYKKHTGKPSMTWPESVDQALCFGWIDGVRKTVDEETYMIRFCPRRPTSIWSKVNIQKVMDLRAAGLMTAAGEVAFAKRKEEKSGIYSFENETMALSGEYEKQFKKDKKAWDFYKRQAPSYQKQMQARIMSAKQEKTRLSRLQKLIEACGKGKKLY